MSCSYPYQHLFAALVLAISVPGTAFGQEVVFPSKPIRVIVPWPPGGAVDTTGRLLVTQMASQSGWSFFVENRAGANSIIGADVVIKSSPDGHSLMYNSSSYAINQALYPERNLNVLRDFSPITNSTTTAGSILVINAASPVTTFTELMALARSRAQAGKPLAYGSAGIGNNTHLTTELLSMRTGVPLLHIPHKGVPQTVTSVIQGNVDLLITQGTAVAPFIKQGKLRALAVTGDSRIALTPNTPTLAELGVPGFPIPGNWSGWFAPAKTPRDIVMKLNGEIRKALQAPAVKEALAATGNEPVGGSPEEFAKLIASEIERYVEVVRVAKIQVD